MSFTSVLLFAFFMAGSSVFQTATPTAGSTPLSLEGIVAMVQAGLPEDVVIPKIKKNNKSFDLNADELVDLKKQGLTELEIKFLLDPTQPYTPAPPAKHYPGDTHSTAVPPEPGLYLFPGDAVQQLELKMLLGQKEGGLLKKSGSVAYLAGPDSRNKVKELSPVFYMRLPEGKSMEEIVLVALETKKDRRELDLGPHQKEQLKPNIVRQFDTLEVGPHLYRITVSKLTPGQYLFFMTGSTDPAKGNYGKGYDFAVEADGVKP
jgi:hypothetical protein